MRGAINLADIGGDKRWIRRLGSVEKGAPVDAQKNSDKKWPKSQEVREYPEQKSQPEAFFIFPSESYASPKPMRSDVHLFILLFFNGFANFRRTFPSF